MNAKKEPIEMILQPDWPEEKDGQLCVFIWFDGRIGFEYVQPEDELFSSEDDRLYLAIKLPSDLRISQDYVQYFFIHPEIQRELQNIWSNWNVKGCEGNITLDGMEAFQLLAVTFVQYAKVVGWEK